jgi:ATP/maltotriose-dependent transcriptional regulator MalT
MKKRTGAVVFICAIILLIIGYHLVPIVRRYIVIYGALIALLGILLMLFLHWISLQSGKGKPSKEIIESRIDAILSPIAGLCLGRDTELSQLERDLENKNILLIKGIAGIGKTTLGRKFRDTLKEKGYQTLWHQFDSQSYEGLLRKLSLHLKNRGSSFAIQLKDQSIPPQNRLRIAVQELCSYPTVVFLDNFQVFIDDSDFEIFRDYLRNSHLIIKSRTQPSFLPKEYENLQYLDENSSVELLKTLKVNESQKVLETIYEKTKGHPWSLVHFAELSRILPVKNLLEELPDFGKEQHDYISEQCWNHLGDSERDFLLYSMNSNQHRMLINGCSEFGMPCKNRRNRNMK